MPYTKGNPSRYVCEEYLNWKKITENDGPCQFTCRWQRRGGPFAIDIHDVCNEPCAGIHNSDLEGVLHHCSKHVEKFDIPRGHDKLHNMLGEGVNHVK